MTIATSSAPGDSGESIMRLISRLSLLVAVSIAFGAAAPAQVWTRFRGPNGTGLSNDTFPPTWTDKDIAWKVQLPGGGHSSPVLWGNQIFLNCGNDRTGEMTLVSLSATDGSILWKAPLNAHTFKKHADNSYATSTPSVDAEEVFVCWTTPEALSVSAF